MRRLIVLSFLASILTVAFDAHAQSGPYQYFPLTPCRAVDTRNPNSTNGGPIFGTDTTRSFQMRGVCGIPTSAKAISLNVTVVSPNQPSFLTVWPSNLSRPVVSMLNFESGDLALANGIIVGVSTNTQDLSVYNNFGQVHVLIDVTGYFQ